MAQVRSVLKPFKDATNALSTVTATLGNVIPVIRPLRKMAIPCNRGSGPAGKNAIKNSGPDSELKKPEIGSVEQGGGALAGSQHPAQGAGSWPLLRL